MPEHLPQKNVNFTSQEVADKVSKAFRKYGNTSLSGQVTQPGLNYFYYGSGLLAYCKYGHQSYVLGDPLTSPDTIKPLLDSFITAHPFCNFVQISPQTGRYLAAHRFYVNCFGTEQWIQLPYARDGNEKAWVRNLYNAGRKHDMVVRELTEKYINKAVYLSIRSGTHKKRNRLQREFSFLARTASSPLPSGSRIFGGFINGSLTGYSIFDPLYNDNQLVGYSEVIPKRTATAPKGTRIYILLEAMDQFQREGCTEISLGLSPLEQVKYYDNLSGFPYSRFTQKTFELLYKRGSFLFNFSGLASHKKRIGGEARPVYLATRASLPVRELLHIYRLTTNYRWPPGMGFI